MPSDTCPGSGSTLMRLPRTLVPSQSTRAATKGTGMPGAAKATMVKALTSPEVAIGTFTIGTAALGVGAAVAAVEVAGAATGALIGHQVGIAIEHEVVDDRDRTRHEGPP